MAGSRVMAIGAHPDDIELGCGGSLARHVAVGDEVTMLVVTDGQSGPGDVGLRYEEACAAAAVLGARVIFGHLDDGDVSPSKGTVGVIEAALQAIEPAIVYTHAQDDSHQDHKAVCAATLSAARNVGTILHYQAPSTRGFDPAFFVTLNDEAIHVKMEALSKHASQVENSDRVNFDAIDAAARYWGVQARTKYAEGFEVTRALANPTRNGLIVGDRRNRTISTIDGVERRGETLQQYERMIAQLHDQVSEFRTDPTVGES